MQKTAMASIAIAAMMGVTPPLSAQAAEQASAEERLEAAKQRLEEAAREVAELAAEIGGEEAERILQIRVPWPRRAMLGINLGDADPSAGGVRVQGVSPGGPAAEAGVAAADLIVAIDGKPVSTNRELVAAMHDIEPGQKVTLDLRRDGKPLKLSVVTRPMDRMFLTGAGMAGRGHGAVHPLPPLEAMPLVHARRWLLESWGDAELVTVTPALGRYFGADKGVLVARAPSDGTLGLQDGDIIVAIGGREPRSGPHAMRILRSYQPGETVELQILRDRKAQTLKATVPATPG